MADGSIIIDTRIDTGGVSKGLNAVKAGMTRISAQVSKMGDSAKSSFQRQITAITGLYQNYEKQERKVSELKSKLEENSEKSTQMWVETRKAGKLTRKAETDTIQKLVEYAKGQGSSHAEMLYMTYSRLANKMAGINKRDEATVMQLNNLSLMENIILHEVDLGIMRGKHYQEIYRDCKKRLEAVKDLTYLEAV